MPTTAWSLARTDILRPIGLVEAATTTNITTNNVVVSTTLANLYTVNDSLIGWFVLLLNDSDGSTSTNTGVIRRITDYVASSGTLTVSGAALQAEDEAIDLILMRFNPDQVKAVFNRIRTNVYPSIGIVRDHQPLVTGQVQRRFQLPTTLRNKPLQVSMGEWPDAASITENEITDPGLENWTNATTLASWAVSGSSATVNQEAQTSSPRNYQVFQGQNSARVLTATSGATTLLQTVTPSVGTQAVEANFSAAVYAVTGTVKARIVSTDGTAHGLTGWEIVSSVVNIAEATTVSVGVVETAGAAAASMYIDENILILGQSEPVVPAWQPMLNWDWIPNISGASNNGYIEFPYNLPEHNVLRVISRDFLSSVSSDTDTFEIDGDLLEPVYDAVRAELLQEVANVGIFKPAEVDFWFKQAAFYRQRSESGLQRRHISVPNPRLKVPDMPAPRPPRRAIAR